MKEFRLEYHDTLKTIYLCRNDVGLKDFLENNFVPPDDVYVDKEMKLYKALNSNSPSILECFGMCNKNLKKNKNDLMKRFSNVKGYVKYDLNFQLGGSMLINNKGKIVFSYIMKYYGDHCKPEEIITYTKRYFGLKEGVAVAEGEGVILNTTQKFKDTIKEESIQLNENKTSYLDQMQDMSKDKNEQ